MGPPQNPIFGTTMRNRSDHIRPWSPHRRPSRTRRTANVGHRGSGTKFIWKNIAFRFRARLPSKLHRQLLHKHHLQSHLQWGNDLRGANHNGIPSATHPPAPLVIPFTMRERSYSLKSQWHTVDHKCTKSSWNPLYNAEPIRPYPPMIRPHRRPSRTRTAQVDHRGSGTNFYGKKGFRASAIS